MLDSETKRHIDACRDILVGKVPDPKAQVEQITTALIYKFMDDMDRESAALGGARSFISGDLERFAWDKLMSRKLGGIDRWDFYGRAVDAFSKSEQLPRIFRDIFKDAYVPYRDPETLNLFLKEIDWFNYDHSENLGDAYEYLLSVLGSQGDAGQFRTPRHIIDFIIQCVDPGITDTILDPACGTAGFLISAYRHIKDKYETGPVYRPVVLDDPEPGPVYRPVVLDDPEPEPVYRPVVLDDPEPVGVGNGPGSASTTGRYTGSKKMSKSERERLIKNIQGYDISPDMVRISKVNMYLHSFPEPSIIEYDTLTSEDRWDDKFDVILANPPFMSPKGGVRPHKKYALATATRTEVLFSDYIMEHLKPGGRAGFIVPEGIIFQSGTVYKELRKLLVEDYGLYAVVSLPAGVFNPYSGVKTSILFLDRGLPKDRDTVAFFKVENDGYGLGAQRRANDKNDLPRVKEELAAYRDSIRSGAFRAKGPTPSQPGATPQGLIVTKEKIAASGDYNLSGERYREGAANSTTHPSFPLSDLCDIFNGSTPSKQEPRYWENGTVPWFTVEDIRKSGRIIEKTEKFVTEAALKETSIKLLPKHAVLLCCTASVGEYAFTEIEVTTNQQFNGLVVKKEKEDKLLPMFLYAIAGRFKEELIRLSGKTSFNFVSVGTLKTMVIPLPPLSVQKEIVAEIEAYQNVINGARAVLDNYRPHIPIHPAWPMVELGEVCDVRDGTHDSPKYVLDDGYPLITSKNLKNGFIDFADVNLISRKDLEAINKRSKVDEGDLLMPMIGTIGNPVIADSSREYAVKNVALIKFPTGCQVDNRFLKDLLDSATMLTMFNQQASGSTQKFISLGFIRALSIPLPPLSTQQSIVSEIEAEQSLVAANRELIVRMEKKIQSALGRVWGV